MEKFNCEIGAADDEACATETEEATLMRSAIESDALTATEGHLHDDFEELAGFDNDLPHELDERSADRFLREWNISLSDHLRDKQME